MESAPAVKTKTGRKTKPKGKAFSEEAFFKRLRIKTHGDIFGVMSKLTRLSAQGRISTDRYKGLMTGLSLMHSALDKAIDEAVGSTSGVHHGQPLVFFYGFPDESQRLLFEFYHRYWYCAYLKTHPILEGESTDEYIARLSSEFAPVSDWNHFVGLPIDLIEDEEGQKALIELVRNEVEGDGDEEP